MITNTHENIAIDTSASLNLINSSYIPITIQDACFKVLKQFQFKAL
ncbi:hypothetical protein CPS_3730 [Colwellia psychrerythraea 34H]|uniref:Uncharacterized protein n=1 Tax=Colwellia psychrerythraea (strain 34H / ATCC BAA-681) TaxID=167879 RepID=Q47XS3_COLP3|nr:hypothetical protein CPS_3730 [Colwellia psychrerythraea 34H]